MLFHFRTFRGLLFSSSFYKRERGYLSERRDPSKGEWILSLWHDYSPLLLLPYATGRKEEIKLILDLGEFVFLNLVAIIPYLQDGDLLYSRIGRFIGGDLYLVARPDVLRGLQIYDEDAFISVA